MRVIVGGTPQEVPDSYAARLIEQARAIPAPPAPRAEKTRGKRKNSEANEVKSLEPQNES